MMAASPLVRLSTFGCVGIQAGAHRSWTPKTGSPVPRKACERLEPDAWKQACPVCAVRRSVVSLAQPGRTWRNVLGSNDLPKAERLTGPEHVSKAAIDPKALTVMRCSTRMIWEKLHCLKSNLQTVIVPTHR
jgi:hypothetical protein